MVTSTNGIAFIKQHEGLRLTAYQCSAGRWTIGYGHTGADTTQGCTISLYEAEELLKRDLKRFEYAVNDGLEGVKLTQNQFDALVSFCYNVGTAAFAGSTLLKKVRANASDPLIAKEFEKWVNAGGKKQNGLVKRRRAEVELYFNNQ